LAEADVTAVLVKHTPFIDQTARLAQKSPMVDAVGLLN